MGAKRTDGRENTLHRSSSCLLHRRSTTPNAIAGVVPGARTVIPRT